MPVSADANKTPSQTPSAAPAASTGGSSGHAHRGSNATKTTKDQGASGATAKDRTGGGGNHKSSSSEVPSHLKKRGVATPASMMALHRRGYILDGGNTLGSGAYAKVKVGTALKMNMQVAIKIVNKLATPKEVVERFLPREIETMKAVDNEHIIKLYEVIETPETIFFILELADRGDLLDFINERKYLSERLARGFFSDLVKGIDHCHARGVVHRDLKCENLLLDSHMRLKISDFGFARKYTSNLKTFCGSFAYAAPEVILGNPYNGPLADIWSMGVILYAMVTGRLPFKDTSTSILMADIAAGVKFSTRHTDKLRSLITRILTFLPHDRADMAYIQSHPWMNVPLGLTFPPNTPGHEDKLHIAPEPTPSQARRASQPPPVPTKLKERSITVPHGLATITTPQGGSKETVPREAPPANQKSKQETLRVPIGTDTLTINSPPGQRSRSRSLPGNSLDPTFPITIIEDSESNHKDSAISTDGTVSRVLDYKGQFHSESRYERRGSTTSEKGSDL